MVSDREVNEVSRGLRTWIETTMGVDVGTLPVANKTELARLDKSVSHCFILI